MKNENWHLLQMINNDIKQQIMKLVSDSSEKLTQRDLEKQLSQDCLSRKDIKLAIKELAESNELVYTNIYGRSFLEKSFNKPVRISKKTVLKPPGASYTPEPDDIVIEVQQGASFGDGTHPSTRLALMGTEYALQEAGLHKPEKETCALDIGTGSGVLAIAAVLMGIKTAAGIDIDPCAISEARENVRINRLEHRISIYNHDVIMSGSKGRLEPGRRFSLVLANLRFPTLKSIYPHLSEITDHGGCIVISGIKADEVSDLLNVYSEPLFKNIWNRKEKSWACLVLQRLPVNFNSGC
ncbi:MAG: methyltransferase domain-containing protein [Desulfobacterales bacterium]|nr:methyltransferase domain-containing protein [Desulfobacterales bacterium]